MRKLWRSAILAGGAAVLAAGLAVTAAPAGATMRPAAQVMQPQRLVASVSCKTDRHFKEDWITFTHCDGEYERIPCAPTPSGNPFGPLYVANGCPAQLWLWLGKSPTGSPDLCVNPESSTGALHRDYNYYALTMNFKEC